MITLFVFICDKQNFLLKNVSIYCPGNKVAGCSARLLTQKTVYYDTVSVFFLVPDYNLHGSAWNFVNFISVFRMSEC